MPLKSFRLSVRNSVDGRRFKGLSRVLDGLRPEIEKELEKLRRDLARTRDRAAFSMEAMENGDGSESMSADLDTLARDLEANRDRQFLLERQMSFLTRVRADLPRLLRSHRT